MTSYWRTTFFALTGGICAVLNIAVLLVGEFLGMHYAASVTASFVICVLVGFLLHCRFTYSTAPDLTGFLRYTSAMALNFPLSLLVLWLFHDIIGLAMLSAAVASTGALSAYNLIGSRWAILPARPGTAAPERRY